MAFTVPVIVVSLQVTLVIGTPPTVTFGQVTRGRAGARTRAKAVVARDGLLVEGRRGRIRAREVRVLHDLVAQRGDGQTHRHRRTGHSACKSQGGRGDRDVMPVFVTVSAVPLATLASGAVMVTVVRVRKAWPNNPWSAVRALMLAATAAAMAMLRAACRKARQPVQQEGCNRDCR